MGVPLYFRHVARRYPDVVERLRKPVGDVARLFIDFNGIIHTCAARLPDATHESIISAALEHVTYLTAQVGPTELVFVAADGVCPVAKMVQQRNRRFISDMRPPPEGSAWNSCVVTPGTDFMRRVDERLAEYAAAQPELVRVSGSAAPGEGEHKILDELRSAGPASAAQVDMIYGLDADLIILSLVVASAHGRDMRVLREMEHGGELDVMHINRLADCLHASDGGEDSKDMFLQDYAMLMTLAGNDFLPPLSFIRIKHDGLQHLLRAYSQSRHAGPLVSAPGQLNTLRLAAILQQLVRSEPGVLKQLISTHSSMSTMPNLHHAKGCDAAATRFDKFPIFHPSPAYSTLDTCKMGWCTDYYAALFPAPDLLPSKVAQAYLDGCAWVCAYYWLGGGAVNWEWRYAYPHSPTCADLSNHIVSAAPSLSQGIPLGCPPWLTPNVQLLTVLPPSCRHLLPLHLQPLMVDISLGCLHLYPSSFRLDTFLKVHLWECTALLPDPDPRRISRTVARLCQ